MSLTECHGKPVTVTDSPTAEILAGAREVTHDGHGPGEEYGVIVHRRYPPGWPWEECYSVARCDSPEYRDDTLVTFYTYYDVVVRVERFGPDLTGATG